MKRDALPGLAPLAAPEASVAAAPGWRRALATLAIVEVAIIIAYFSTAATMVATWARTETFAHGFVILPISLWLVWRRRTQVASIATRPSWIVLPIMALVGFVWLLGHVAAVNALDEFAFVGLLVLAVPAVLGVTVTRALLFPLGFLFFAVPFGEFLMPWLMLHTADVTIAAVKASGVPVLREGLQVFSVPNGRWSVVEACSGIRYLIASVVVGALFAYLNYRSWRRRAAFIAVSILVPIGANWIRAYMIVMLGYLSENRIATGVDHIIYGWLFFGLVMLIMFWIGSFWREPEVDALTVPPAPAPCAGAAGATRRPAVATAVAALAVVAAWPIAYATIERAGARTDAVLAPIEVAGWQSTAAPQASFTPHFTNASAVRSEILQHGDATVGLYVAFYRGEDDTHKLVTSGNVLLRADDKMWHATREGSADLTLDERTILVRAATIRDAYGRDLETRMWYWIDGSLTASDALAKGRIAWRRVTGSYRGAAVVVAYAPAGPSAAATLQGFVDAGWPAISKALADARGARR
jgi:exosortase A